MRGLREMKIIQGQDKAWKQISGAGGETSQRKIQAENEVSDSLLVPTHSTLQAWLSMEVGHVHIYFTLYSYVTQGSAPRCMTRWNS